MTTKTKVTKLKTDAEISKSNTYASRCVPNDIKGICAYGCGTPTIGRKTLKFCGESCKQHTKRFIKDQNEKFNKETGMNA